MSTREQLNIADKSFSPDKCSRNTEKHYFNRYFGIWLGLLFIVMIMILYVSIFSDIFLHQQQVAHQKKEIKHQVKQNKLLVIFTTFKNDANITDIHRDIINNWSSLGNDIQPAFFYNITNLKVWDTLALKKGWLGLPLGRKNKFGTPVLKDMYEMISKKIKSGFYGFCNGDILFDHGMKDTLIRILSYDTILKNCAMVIGKRTNVEYQD